MYHNTHRCDSRELLIVVCSYTINGLAIASVPFSSILLIRIYYELLSYLEHPEFTIDIKEYIRISQAIDYDGEKLKSIISESSFQHYFVDLSREDTLKTAPKGFSQDHPHIDLLRLKSFAAMHSLTQKQILQDDFIEQVVKIYLAMLPFRKYLEQAVTF